MKLFWNILAQAVGFYGQYQNVVGGLIPDKYKPAVAITIAAAQGAVAAYAQHFNTDGTPQSQPKL